jgi:hypothetical protein
MMRQVLNVEADNATAAIDPPRRPAETTSEHFDTQRSHFILSEIRSTATAIRPSSRVISAQSGEAD